MTSQRTYKNWKVSEFSFEIRLWQATRKINMESLDATTKFCFLHWFLCLYFYFYVEGSCFGADTCIACCRARTLLSIYKRRYVYLYINKSHSQNIILFRLKCRLTNPVDSFLNSYKMIIWFKYGNIFYSYFTSNLQACTSMRRNNM